MYCNIQVPENISLTDEPSEEAENEGESMLPTKKFNEDTFTVKTMLLRELTGN